MLTEREVALRLARNSDVDRKLRIASNSRFFWFYSLSLWDPDNFWRCASGAACFAAVAFLLTRITFGPFTFPPVVATTMFEYFLFGLILMWFYRLGPWLHPTNLKVIFTFVFRLYRKNRVLDDLSAEEIRHMFPGGKDGWTSVLEEHSNVSKISAVIGKVEGLGAVGSLAVGALFAFFLIALLVLTSYLG